MFKICKIFIGTDEQTFIYHPESDFDMSTCSLALNGTIVLFGGETEKRQVSVVSPLGVKDPTSAAVSCILHFFWEIIFLSISNSKE